MRSARPLIMLYFMLWVYFLPAQRYDSAEIRQLVERLKTDEKGPYKDIRWFCTDGTTQPPDKQCAEPGGVKRARYKDEVAALARSNHIFLGQILAATPFEEFWDSAEFQSRLKQYQIEKYLRNIDDGWVWRNTKKISGASNIVDEENWGSGFLKWLVCQDDLLKANYFLMRQAVNDIPHKGFSGRYQAIMAASEYLASGIPDFRPIAQKIYENPDRNDIESLKQFKQKYGKKLRPDQANKVNALIAGIQDFYKPTDLNALNKYLKLLPQDSFINQLMIRYIEAYTKDPGDKDKLPSTAKMLWNIRSEMATVDQVEARIALLDISLMLEEILFAEASSWKTTTIGELLTRNYYMCLAAAGCGYLEEWEWNSINTFLSASVNEDIGLQELLRNLYYLEKVTVWGKGMTKMVYKEVVDLFSGFDSIAQGFMDIKNRSSVLSMVENGSDLLRKFVNTSFADEKMILSKETVSTSSQKINIPIVKMEPGQSKAMSLKRLSSDINNPFYDASVKALAHLKNQLPAYVDEAIVIPYVVFSEHLNQVMPGKNMSYQKFAGEIINTVDRMEKEGLPEKEVQDYLISRAEELGKAIRKLPMFPTFLADLSTAFKVTFNVKFGTLPVMVNTVTNLGDLIYRKEENPDPGNVYSSFEKIHMAIREEWAMLFSPEGFRWRRQYFNNPENLLASVIIMPATSFQVTGSMYLSTDQGAGNDEVYVTVARGMNQPTDFTDGEAYQILPGGIPMLLNAGRNSMSVVSSGSGQRIRQRITTEKPVLHNGQFKALNEMAELIQAKWYDDKSKNTSGNLIVTFGISVNEIHILKVYPIPFNSEGIITDEIQPWFNKVSINRKLNSGSPL